MQLVLSANNQEHYLSGQPIVRVLLHWPRCRKVGGSYVCDGRCADVCCPDINGELAPPFWSKDSKQACFFSGVPDVAARSVSEHQFALSMSENAATSCHHSFLMALLKKY